MARISDSEEESLDSYESEVDELEYVEELPEKRTGRKIYEDESEEVFWKKILKLKDELLTESSEDDEIDDDREELLASGPSKKKSTFSSHVAPKPKKQNAKKSKQLIQFEPVNIPKGDPTVVEKFISVRVNADQTEDVLVKHKNVSYMHCVWVPLKELEADKLIRVRVRRFLEKPSYETQWSEDEPFNPSYLKVDRIIDDGEADGELFYLVKWCSQPYSESTWESSTVIDELDPDKIDDFEFYRTPSADRKASYSQKGRKIIGKWAKLPESPKFKDDNSLRSYQLEGLNWLMFCWHNNQNSILADEMGLGKTVQSTAFLYELYRTQKIIGPFLVIVPLSTMGNWEREMKGWTDMNVVVYHGNQASRNLIVETEFYFRNKDHELEPGVFKFDVVLTTYEVAISGAHHLRPVPWKVCILDEAHRLKNKKSKVTEFLRSYHMEHRVLLTGTPLQNSLDELWALLNFLEPQQFASDREFQEEYGNMSSAADVEKLQLLLKPLMLRRLKEDVEKSIPVKEETIVEVELTTTQKKWYRSILEKNFSWLKQGSKKNNVPNLVNTMIELRKCCIHPWLLKGAEDQILMELKAEHSDELHAKALIISSGKMVLLDKLLTKLKTDGHKVLIFSQMTRCLDLIQEYVRAKNWNFERIDGSVRGELRQASIDRFSAPGADSFIFLLCTRAGGVGINLTAADTCIIFDSDWNPQNDLQAQSRIHRIGQKKPVKIYRLITRNTYEREMFDRASMKLGLDKALLQRGGDGDPFDTKTKSGNLSKQEVEELLKKGAYGAFMDDGAGDKFCEEDIEQILERRTMVIRHDEDSERKKGSMFSKASFQAAGSSSIDVNDPQFWDKVAEQAQLEIIDEAPEDSLIVHGTRDRRQTKYAEGGVDADPSEDFKVYKPPNAKPWTTTERNQLERAIMQHGYFHFSEIAETFPRRTADDLKACARDLLIKCIEIAPNSDRETINEVKRAISVFYPPDEDGSDDYGDQKAIDMENNPQLVEIHDEDLPYPAADDREQYEFISYLRDAAEDYTEHLTKKAKNLLIRVALMYNIRQRAQPTPDMYMPRLNGADLAMWWGPEQDRDLLIGIARYGYQQYGKIWRDPELCFFKVLPQVEEIKKSDDAEEEIEELDEQPISHDDNDDIEMAGHNAAEISAAQAPNAAYYVPSPTELGLRVRKIINGLARYRLAATNGADASSNAKNRKDKLQDKRRGKENDMSKKSKQDFQKGLLAFGLERTDQNGFIWTKFKEIAELSRKSDEVLTLYLEHLVGLSIRTIEYHVNIAVKKSAATPVTDGSAIIADISNPDYPVGEEGETLTIDRAKKVLRRIETFDKLRLEVLRMPDLAQRFANADRHGNSGLPRWWDNSYDIPFLQAIDRYGYSRGEAFVDADDLPFKGLYLEYLRSLEIRRNENLDATQLVNNIWEEKFWMRDSIALKRFELLVNLAEKQVKEPRKAGRPKNVKLETVTKQSIAETDPATSSGYIPAKYQTNVPAYQNDSSGDTDEMLKTASDTLIYSKKKRAELLKTDSVPEVKPVHKVPPPHDPQYQAFADPNVDDYYIRSGASYKPQENYPPHPPPHQSQYYYERDGGAYEHAPAHPSYDPACAVYDAAHVAYDPNRAAYDASQDSYDPAQASYDSAHVSYDHSGQSYGHYPYHGEYDQYYRPEYAEGYSQHSHRPHETHPNSSHSAHGHPPVEYAPQSSHQSREHSESHHEHQNHDHSSSHAPAAVSHAPAATTKATSSHEIEGPLAGDKRPGAESTGNSKKPKII